MIAQFTDPSGGATAMGIWVLMAFGAIFALAGGANQIMGVLLKRKQLNAPVGTQINPQPLIVAMEKEFVHRRDYDAEQADMKNQIKEGRQYAHGEVHEVRNDLQAMKLAGDERDALLHKLDERTMTHTRVMSGMDLKLDRVVDRMADKVEAILRNNRGRDE